MREEQENVRETAHARAVPEELQLLASSMQGTPMTEQGKNVRIKDLQTDFNPHSPST